MESDVLSMCTAVKVTLLNFNSMLYFCPTLEWKSKTLAMDILVATVGLA